MASSSITFKHAKIKCRHAIPVLASLPLASPVTIPTATTPQPQFSGVTIAEIFHSEADPGRTDLQKDDFRRRYDGKIVQCQATVDGVKQQWSAADSDVIAVLYPNKEKYPKVTELFTASFPARLKDSLADLQPGDIITIRGTLRFLDNLWHAPALNLRTNRKLRAMTATPNCCNSTIVRYGK